MISEDASESGARVRVPPPAVPVAALLIGWGVDFFVGPVIENPLSGASRWAVGAVLVAMGLLLVSSAIQLFKKSGQDPTPWKSSPSIIASGIYRWTRNPMYLGLGLLQGGLGLLVGSFLVVALVPVTWFAIYLIAIRHEEQYLEEKFGESYLDYKNSVRRWF